MCGGRRLVCGGRARCEKGGCDVLGGMDVEWERVERERVEREGEMVWYGWGGVDASMIFNLCS